ncbi:MAG TPA: hypothetical protein VEP89_03160, partial [Draconibacterium sp.]|nr:hypothetical protein [Draconibacterium sp.]
MTKKLTFIVLAFILCIGNASAQNNFQSNKLTKVWETDDGLFTPESAHYNKNDNTIYVSNIAGDYKVDGKKGYISKLDANGKILTQKWLEGLKAPKGIYTSKTKLYVTDIDCVLEIDLRSGEVLN